MQSAQEGFKAAEPVVPAAAAAGHEVKPAKLQVFALRGGTVVTCSR